MKPIFILLILSISICFITKATEDEKGFICGKQLADEGVVQKIDDIPTLLAQEPWLARGKIEYISDNISLRAASTMVIPSFISEFNMNSLLITPDDKNRMVVTYKKTKTAVLLFFFVKEGSDYFKLVGDFIKNSKKLLDLEGENSLESGIAPILGLMAYGTESPLITAYNKVLENLGWVKSSSISGIPSFDDATEESDAFFDKNPQSVISMVLRSFAPMPKLEGSLADQQQFKNATTVNIIYFHPQ